MEAKDWITASISVVALIVSIYALWHQHRTNGRAHFTVDWENSSNLLLTNRGPGSASKVQTRTTDDQVKESALAADYIGAGQTMRLHRIPAFGAAPPSKLELTWKDNRLRKQARVLDIPQPRFDIGRSEKGSALQKAVAEVARAVARDEIDQDHAFWNRQGR